MKITEHHLVSDFTRPAHKDSSLIPGKKQTGAEYIFRCPMCGTDQDAPDHGQRKRCMSAKCDAEFLAYGNYLEITATPPKGIKND